MISILETLQQKIAAHLASKNITVTPDDVFFEHPLELSHGDYATNVAMRFAKQLDISPKDLAEEIAGVIDGEKFIDKVLVAGPGFINIVFSPEFYRNQIYHIFERGDDNGRTNIYRGKKVLVEHSSPNLFKTYHIGHVMNNAIGESVARLMNYSGAEVTVISYPSDVSLGIGKAVWALLESGVEVLDALQDEKEKISFLGDCYVKGTRAYDEDPAVQERVREITTMLYEETPGPEFDAYQKGKEINLTYFLDITRRLGSTFDGFIFESQAGTIGKKLVEEHTGIIFKKSNGAIIYEGEQDDLHTRVFINKEGYPTYEAKDLGLLKLKFDTYDPDLSLFVTDHEQGPYFQVVVTAAGKINKQWKEKTHHLVHGRMQFRGQKMSSRLGGVPLAVDVLDMVNNEVRARMDKDRQMDDLVDAVGISALKFTILRAMAGKNINFDPDTSLSFEGDSGPYIQYTHARCCSIIEKAEKELGIIHNHLASAVPQNNWTPTGVEKLAYWFPEVVSAAVEGYMPHFVAGYLLQLSQAFNSWYGNTHILVADDEDTTYKVALTASVAQIIKNGLYLLGIKAPDEM